MNHVKRIAALALALALVLYLAACGGSKTRKVTDFLTEKMPGEYAEATKATTVTDASDGSFNVELTIDLPSGGASDEDMFDTIAFEASYLIDEIFAEPPYPLNFKIHFLKDGADFGDIERAHDNPVFYRTYQGTTDTFQFQM